MITKLADLVQPVEGDISVGDALCRNLKAQTQAIVAWGVPSCSYRLMRANPSYARSVNWKAGVAALSAKACLISANVAGDAVDVLKDRTLGQRSQIEDADVLAAYSDFARLETRLKRSSCRYHNSFNRPSSILSGS